MRVSKTKSRGTVTKNNINSKTMKKDSVDSLIDNFEKIGMSNLLGNKRFRSFLLEAMSNQIEKENKSLKNKIVVNSKEFDQEAAFAKANEKIAKLVEKVKNKSEVDEDDDEAAGSGKRKYEHIDSILKYVEHPDDKGPGIKLVIMNFND